METKSLFPELELNQKAAELSEYIARLQVDIADLGEGFHDPQISIKNQQRRVEQLIRSVVEMGFYKDRDEVWNRVRNTGERGKIHYPDFQKRVLGMINWYQEVLKNITIEGATTVEDAIAIQRQKTAEWARSVREALQQ